MHNQLASSTSKPINFPDSSFAFHGGYAPSVPILTLSADTLYGVSFFNPGAIKVDACTINRTGAGSGNIATAIYKYNPTANQYPWTVANKTVPYLVICVIFCLPISPWAFKFLK